MTKFETLYRTAVKKVGSEQELAAKLPTVKSSDELKAIGDDRYLAMITKCVFRAGFVWRVIENKWSGFEVAFSEFNPLAIAHYPDERLEELAQDERIVRNLQKIKTVRENALLVLDMQREHGSFANWIADWPADDIVGLWDVLKKRGARLGGNSGPGFLRGMGKDTFILTEDVKAALINHGLIDRISPSSKRDQQRVQEIFNQFQAESGRPLAEISRILSHTV